MDGVVDRAGTSGLPGSSTCAQFEARHTGVELVGHGRGPAQRNAPSEFVPLRIEVDVERLRAELIGLAVLWLGVADASPIAGVIRAARPGVEEFVAAIAFIPQIAIPGPEPALIRALTREMHYRAAQTLCGA